MSVGSKRGAITSAEKIVLFLTIVLILPGCLFFPPREGLERLKKERGAPYATTVFRKEPRVGERPLSELKVTLEYWLAAGSRGEPRWKGVLVPEPEDLYARLLAILDHDASSITLVAYRYDSAGLDPITLVDYFDGGGHRVGWDHVAFPEARPPSESRLLVGFHNFAWWEYPLMLVDLPVYTALGLKELVGEAARSPLSFVAQGWIGTAIEGRSPASPLCFERSCRWSSARNWN